MDHLKIFTEFFTRLLLLFMCWVFWPQVTWESAPPALGEVWTPGPPGESWQISLPGPECQWGLVWDWFGTGQNTQLELVDPELHVTLPPMAWLCVPDLSSRALAAALLQRPEEQNPDATSLQWLCWDELSWRLPVSEGKTSPWFRAMQPFPRAHRGLAIGLVAGPEGLRMSKSERLPPGLGVTVRAGQVRGCPSWLPGCELLQGGLTLLQCPNVQRTFCVWEALPLPRGWCPSRRRAQHNTWPLITGSWCSLSYLTSPLLVFSPGSASQRCTSCWSPSSTSPPSTATGISEASNLFRFFEDTL